MTNPYRLCRHFIGLFKFRWPELWVGILASLVAASLWAIGEAVFYSKSNFSSVSHAPATLQNPPSHVDLTAECEELAGDPDDPRIRDGVPLDQIKAKPALEACNAAVQHDPGNPQLIHQRGRAYQAAGDSNACSDFSVAARDGYPPAMTKDAECFIIEDRYDIAEPKLRAAIAAGSAEALYWMGLLEIQGKLASKNEATSGRDFIRQAAQMGNPKAILYARLLNISVK